MKPGKWVFFDVCRDLAAWLVLAWTVLVGSTALAAPPQEPSHAMLIRGFDALPPQDQDPRWERVSVPDGQVGGVAWYRVEFQLDLASSPDYWMLYLPYFYGGGRIWLNSEPVAAVTESTDTTRVRWERPVLLPLPRSAMRPGVNVLHLRVAPAHGASGTRLPGLMVGSQADLQPYFDRRLFLVRTVPLVTVAAGSVMGIVVIGIWLRRRQEVLYGLFGAAALLWALRTTTFIFDALPTAVWPYWRLVYHLSTGGFIIVLALYSLQLAGWGRRSITVGLGLYALLGPILFALGGENAEALVGRWWVLGLIPIGMSVAIVSFAAVWRQRTMETGLIALGVLAAVLTGVHDYMVAWSSPWLQWLAPQWSGHRFFLLHHGANLLLMVMGMLLAMRLVRSLQDVEEANRTLEARVQARESEIAASYARVTELQRDQATLDERQRIMQDLHDGLGAQLFTSLLQAQRGALDSSRMAGVLRQSIDEMRVAIEALASDEQDFRTVFGNFRFRWDQRLRDAQVVPQWRVDLPDAVFPVPPHTALQLLRIVQEALTNVLKHSGASRVGVDLKLLEGSLRIEIVDNGQGMVHDGRANHAGRGFANMQARAARLGAQLQFDVPTGGGCRLTLVLPSTALPTAAPPRRPS